MDRLLPPLSPTTKSPRFATSHSQPVAVWVGAARGFPRGQRMRIVVQADFEDKIALAKRIAGIDAGSAQAVEDAEAHLIKVSAIPM